jgi:O-antigen ligase
MCAKKASRAPIRTLRLRFDWHQLWVAALIFGLLVLLTVYTDEHAMDTSLLPRLRGLYATLIAALCVLLLPATAKRLDPSTLRDPVVLCYGLFSALCFVSLLWAINPTAGFTDAFKTFGAFVFLCLLCLLLPSMPLWPQRLLQIFVCGALVSAGWGIYEMTQLFGLSFVRPRGEMKNVLGTMANVNLYAGFLALIIPLCLCATAVLRGGWRTISALAALAVVLVVALLQTRAAYLGVLASLAAGIVCATIFAPVLGIKRTRQTAILFSTVAALGGLCAFYLLAPEENPIALRLRSIIHSAETASGGARFMAWQISLQMAKDHFPWGVGTGNFTMRLDEYFNASTDFRGAETNWIYPHNDFLWVLAELGLPGMVAFIGIFLFAFRNCLAVLRCSDASLPDAWLALAVMMAMVAYLVDSLFGFPLARITHQVYLAALFAISVLLVRRNQGAAKPPERYPRWLLSGALPTLLILLLGFSYARAAIKQEFFLAAVFELEAEEMWPAALRVIRAAQTPWKTTDPFATPLAYTEARVLKQVGTKDETLNALQRAYAHNPNRLHVINDLGTYYAMTGRFDEAIALLNKTVKRYPHQVYTIENLTQCYIDQDDYASALKILEEIPEDRRTDAIRTKIIGCRQALEAARTEKAGSR